MSDINIQSLSEESVKAQARRLQSFLSLKGITLNHTACLDAIAVSHAHKSWQHLKSAFNSIKSAESSIATVNDIVGSPSLTGIAFEWIKAIKEEGQAVIRAIEPSYAFAFASYIANNNLNDRGEYMAIDPTSGKVIVGVKYSFQALIEGSHRTLTGSELMCYLDFNSSHEVFLEVVVGTKVYRRNDSLHESWQDSSIVWSKSDTLISTVLSHDHNSAKYLKECLQSINVKEVLYSTFPEIDGKPARDNINDVRRMLFELNNLTYK